MILHSTWKKVILFSLINFSSQCSALYCVFNGWRADEPRSTLPKVEKAAFTVVRSKIHNLVYIGAAYWCRLFICTLKCWIYCYVTLYTLQNSSGQLLFLWIPLLCLLLCLLSSVAASCSLSHRLHLQQSLLLGLGPIFRSWCLSYPTLAIVLAEMQ